MSLLRRLVVTILLVAKQAGRPIAAWHDGSHCRRSRLIVQKELT